MNKIAIVTDSNSGITQKMAKEMGVYVLPMPFFINGELFLEDISLSQEEFYKYLTEDAGYQYVTAVAKRSDRSVGSDFERVR